MKTEIPCDLTPQELIDCLDCVLGLKFDNDQGKSRLRLDHKPVRFERLLELTFAPDVLDLISGRHLYTPAPQPSPQQLARWAPKPPPQLFFVGRCKYCGDIYRKVSTARQCEKTSRKHPRGQRTVPLERGPHVQSAKGERVGQPKVSELPWHRYLSS